MTLVTNIAMRSFRLATKFITIRHIFQLGVSVCGGVFSCNLGEGHFHVQSKKKEKSKSSLKLLCQKGAFSRLLAWKILRKVLKNPPSGHPYNIQVVGLHLGVKNQIYVEKSKVHFSTQNYLKSTLEGPQVSRIKVWSKNRKRASIGVKSLFFFRKWKVHFSTRNDLKSTLEGLES